MNLELNSADEARALLRAIVASKFTEAPYDMDVLTSKHVANLAADLCKIVAEKDREQWGEIGRQMWDSWYWLSPPRPEWRIALNHGKALFGKKWASFFPDRRVEVVKLLISPYGLSDELLSQFITELDVICTGSS